MKCLKQQLKMRMSQLFNSQRHGAHHVSSSNQLWKNFREEYKGKSFYIADIETDGINTASAAGIRGVPTVIIYKKGTETSRIVGGVPEGKMKEFLDENI